MSADAYVNEFDLYLGTGMVYKQYFNGLKE